MVYVKMVNVFAHLRRPTFKVCKFTIFEGLFALNFP